MIRIKKTWAVPQLTGYNPITNYWEQFTQAESQDTEQKAIKACKALLKQLLPEAREDHKKYTELVMILNHKCWDHANMGQHLLGQWYSDEYLKKHNWALNHFKGEPLTYYYQTLD